MTTRRKFMAGIATVFAALASAPALARHALTPKRRTIDFSSPRARVSLTFRGFGIEYAGTYIGRICSAEGMYVYVEVWLDCLPGSGSRCERLSAVLRSPLVIHEKLLRSDRLVEHTIYRDCYIGSGEPTAFAESDLLEDRVLLHGVLTIGTKAVMVGHASAGSWFPLDECAV